MSKRKAAAVDAKAPTLKRANAIRVTQFDIGDTNRWAVEASPTTIMKIVNNIMENMPSYDIRIAQNSGGIRVLVIYTSEELPLQMYSPYILYAD